MGFSEIIGQERIVRLLRRALVRKQIPQTLLFTGMEGVGKRSTALTLARAVNCERSSDGDCCDQCLSCRKAASGNHPDLLTIHSKGQFIKIDQIRSLQLQLRFRPLEGRSRVVVICQAQNLKTEAANALLRILEEPPPQNILVLTATDTTALLPTIVSRCLHLRFQPLAPEAIAGYLQRNHALAEDRARVVAALAGGSLSRALEVLDERHLAHRRWLLESVAGVCRASAAELLQTADKWAAEKTDLKEDLELLKLWARDLLAYKLQATDDPGMAGQMAEVPAGLPTGLLLEFFDTLCNLQGALGYNLNKRLCLEVLLLTLRARATGAAAADVPLLPGLQRKPYTGIFYG